MDSITYIYALKDPRNGRIRYVGKADNPQKRLNEHIKDKSTNKHKMRWIGELTALGLKPELVILDTVSCSDWVSREKYWISYGRKNWNLVNITDGGDGLSQSVWVKAMRWILDEERLEKFRNMPEETQKEIAQKTAIAKLKSTGYFHDEEGIQEKAAKEAAAFLIDTVI